MPKRVALYCRLSPRPDGSYEGVDLQEKWGREYAAETWPGLPIEVFADEGISAFKDDAHRPGFERFREALSDGQIAYVWTVEQSRLQRGEIRWFTLAAELDQAGIEAIHTNRDGIVRVRDEVAGIKAVLAAGEVRKLRRRLMDKQDEIAAQGRPPGVTPWGYRRAEVNGTKTLETVPEQADAIRWAADRVLSGWSLANIVRELRSRGLQGARGGTITAASIKSALTSPAIAGQRVHRGEVRGPGNWPPILDIATFRALQARLSEPRIVRRSDGKVHKITEKSAANRAGRKYLLTGGLAVCVCGSPLTGTVKQLRSGKRSYTRPYLLCRKERGGCGRVGIMLDSTEQHVLDMLWVELNKPPFLDAVAADDHAGRRDEIIAELEDLDRQRTELAGMWGTPGELSTSEWKAARQALSEAEHRLRDEMATLPPPLVNVDISDARESWDSMTLDEQRAFIRLFIASVMIKPARPGTKAFDPQRVVIEWRKL